MVVFSRVRWTIRMERCDRRAHARGTRSRGTRRATYIFREWKRIAALVDTFAFHTTTRVIKRYLYSYYCSIIITTVRLRLRLRSRRRVKVTHEVAVSLRATSRSNSRTRSRYRLVFIFSTLNCSSNISNSSSLSLNRAKL